MFSLYYSYILLLLLMLLLCYGMVRTAISYAPKKIKFITILITVAMILKASSLIVLLLKDSMEYIYFLKYLVFIDVIYVPMLIFLCIYIFYRNEKIKLSQIFIPIAMSILIYYLYIIKFTSSITLSDITGYTIDISSFSLINAFYLTINTFILILSIKIYLYKHSIRLGAIFMIFSSSVSLIIFMTVRFNVELRPIIILSDLLWCSSYLYGLKKLKNK